VSGAYHERVSHLESQSDARSEVMLFQVASGAWKTVAAEVVELLRLQVKDGPPIARDGGREVERVAQPEIQGEPAGSTPIVLHKELGYGGSRPRPLRARVRGASE